MKKAAVIFLVMMLVLSIALPTAIAGADPATISVVSDTEVQVVGVYNKYFGPTNFVNVRDRDMYAVLASEPMDYPTAYSTEPPDSIGSVWDNDITGYNFQTAITGADWIWETAHAEYPATVYAIDDPLYDPNPSSNGRVVVFEQTFMVAGTVTSSELHITADNCYEVWINGEYYTRSATAKTAGWENTMLYQNAVDSSNWQTVGNYSIPASYFNDNDTNTITILAGNEYYHPDNATFEFNNSPVPPYQNSPYRQQNPGGLIFKLDVNYDKAPPVPSVPEVPAVVLLCLGLAGLGGFILFTQKREIRNTRS